MLGDRRLSANKGGFLAGGAQAEKLTIRRSLEREVGERRLRSQRHEARAIHSQRLVRRELQLAEAPAYLLERKVGERRLRSQRHVASAAHNHRLVRCELQLADAPTLDPVFIFCCRCFVQVFVRLVASIILSQRAQNSGGRRAARRLRRRRRRCDTTRRAASGASS